MRKITVMMSVSLDGFFEGPNRELDWHLVDDELHRHFNEQLRNDREKIFSLPNDTVLACGHGPLTTVRQEKNHNPFFAR